MTNSHENLDFQAIFSDLLAELSEREREVLKKRYQLTSDVVSQSTLKQIGDIYGITRERVRQIEREAIAKLSGESSKNNYATALNSLRDVLVNYLERKGGVVSEAELLAEHILPSFEFDKLHINSYLFVIDNLIPEVERVEESDNFYTFWKLADVSFDSLQNFINATSQLIAENKKLFSEEELFKLVDAQVLAINKLEHLEIIKSKHNDLSVNDLLRSSFGVTKKIEKNILGDWGLSDWSDVKPKKLSDKIHLIFRQHEKPLHFREVAEHINSAKFDKKNICAATVHNELIANENYVLIGRGIYAKKDWGYTPGTVTDIITDILKKSNRAMSKDEIYAEVLKQRQVNPSTIYLSLINRDKFQKSSEGLFTLNQ